MNKPSKSQVLYERNMELQKAYAEVSSLTEQRDHWQAQALSKSELIAALEARCSELEAHAHKLMPARSSRN